MEPTPIAIQAKAASSGPSSALARRIEPAPATQKRPPGRKAWQVVLLPVDQVGPNPFQPRQSFDPVEMEELTQSVKEHGVLQPVTVRTLSLDKTSKGEKKPLIRYHLVAGERRLRACKAASRRFIPAIIRDDLSDQQAAELALLENVQRYSLNVIEEANAYKRLMLDFRMKEERIAKKVGKSVQSVRDTIRLLQLPASVQTMLAQKKLTPTHGQHLLKLAAFDSVCLLVAHKVVSENVTATSLNATLLPNARELCNKGLAVELDYRTKFDWKSACGACPHKAYVSSGYASFCLHPKEWNRKQSEAIELHKQEAARVLAQAKAKDGNAVEAQSLPPGSYRDLSYGGVPAGCSESCACRGELADPRDPTKTRPVCLDPSRLHELVKAEREAHEAERRRRFEALWKEAVSALNEQREQGNSALCTSIALLPLLCGSHLRYGEQEVWQKLAGEVAQELGIKLPHATWFDPDVSSGESLKALQEIEPQELLRYACCLLLAHEALRSIRFGGETPLLLFALGREAPTQGELSEAEDVEPEPEFAEEDEVLESEAAVEESYSERSYGEQCRCEQQNGERPFDEPRYGYPDVPGGADIRPDELVTLPA